jgi:outer membrane lipoprotein-sorting protein
MPSGRPIPLATTIFCAVLCLAKPARAQDPSALLAKMEAAYAGMKSYSHKMSATWHTKVDGKEQSGIITSELRYRQPNHAHITVVASQGGSIAVVSDGKQVTGYQSNLRTFTRGPAPPTMDRLVQTLPQYGVIAMLDPLYLLSGQNVERLAEGFVTEISQPINGVKCSVIAGNLTPAALSGATSGRVRYFIDPSTFLIRRLRIELQGVPTRVPTARKSKGKTQVTITTTRSDRVIVETILDARVNPPFDPWAFMFSIPKGAVQQSLDQFLKRK